MAQASPDPAQAAPVGGRGREAFREAEVLALVAQGWTDRRIAHRLGISDRAVRKRLATARDRVGAHSRAHAAALWSRLNP